MQVLAKPNSVRRTIKLKGLDDNKAYRIMGTDEVILGSTIRKVGLKMPSLNGDFKSELIYLESEEK